MTDRIRTRYPDRYKVGDDPRYAEYVPVEPTFIGENTASILPPESGTIIACVTVEQDDEDRGLLAGDNYYLDSDVTLENATHYIWLRDWWQLLKLNRLYSRPPALIEDLAYAAEMAAKEVDGND